MKNFIKKYIYQLLIVLIVAIIALVNYKRGTYLTGWDNLQTDLNPWLGVKRAIFSVWEEYQSFGLLAGMAHAADLPRAVFIWIISFIMPQNMLRYFYQFFMLLVGGLGAFQLISFAGTRKKFAFLGALFYMLNLGTIQMFYLPYEAFTTFFGLLPWEIWIFLKVQNSDFFAKGQSSFGRKTQSLLLFFLINLLATPQAYVQTLFVVYLIMLGCLTLGKFIQEKNPRLLIKSGVLILLIILINSFWLIPQAYFVKTSLNVVKEAKVNQFNDNTYYQNKEKGTIPNLIKFEGYYFDLTGSAHQQLFLPWQLHFNNRIFGLLPYCFALIIILGFFNKKRGFSLPFFVSLLFIVTTLLTATFPFSLINDMARLNGLIDQIFRSPFTKFIIPFSLVSSYFFAFGVEQIEDTLGKVIKERVNFFTLIIFILLLAYALPVFQGYFISPQMKVQIPQQYIQLMSYLKNQDRNKRIALLPDYTFWGWFFHTWGYDGSGFLWYGIEQPIVSRTFDVWSDKSEGYFWEIKSALEAEDTTRFQNVLNKYNIDLIILDHTLLPVSSTIKGMQYHQVEKLLSQDPSLSLVKKWGDIALYSVKHDPTTHNFMSVSSLLPVVGPTIKVTDQDVAYNLYGNYQSGYKNDTQTYFPFLDFMSQSLFHNSWTINVDDRNINLTSPIINGTNLSISTNYNSSHAELFLEGSLHSYDITISPTVTDNFLHLAIPKIPVASFDLSQTNIENCGSTTGNNTITFHEGSIILSSQNKASACFSYQAPGLEERYGYLIKIRNKNLQGPRLFFYIKDQTKQQSYLEARLQKDIEYFILPERYQYGIGYSFVFQNTSYQNSKSINELDQVSIYLLPVSQIKNIQLVNTSALINPPVFLQAEDSHKNAYYLYRINVSGLSEENGNLILYQTFHPGWKAYFIGTPNFLNTYLPFLFGQEIKDHVLINNWANGWQISQSQLNQSKSVESENAVIIFWPQYLEFIGFALLIAGFLFILKLRNE